MGTVPSSLSDHQTHHTSFPFDLQSLTKIEDCSLFTIWADKENKQYELYKTFTSRPLSEQKKIYNFRKLDQPRLVSIAHYEIVNDQFNSSGCLELKVYTERIPSTLSEIEKISLQTGLQILVEAAEGFDIIFKHAGCFDIDDNLIGFNTEGRVKVWVNNNWSLNSKPILQRKKSYPINEHQMVVKLIEIVEKHVELSTLYVNWISGCKSVKQWSFQHLKMFIRGFVVKHKIKLSLDQNSWKQKLNQREQIKKQCLVFKRKSNSPNPKFINVSTSLGNDRNILKPLLISKGLNVDQGEKLNILRIDSDSILPNSQTSGFLTFKNKSKNKNKTKNVSFKQSVFINRQKQQINRNRRKSQQIEFTFKVCKKDHKRMSSTEVQLLRYGKSMMFSQPTFIKTSIIDYTLTVSDPSTTEQSTSLEIKRKQLKKFLGSSPEEDKYRTSYTKADEKLVSNLKESRQFQFKTVNMKKKKKKQESFRLQEPTRESPLLNLRTFAKKCGSKSRQKKILTKNNSASPEIRTRVKSTSHVPTFLIDQIDCKKSALASQKTIQNKPRLNILDHNLKLDSMRSTAPTLKYTDDRVGNSLRPDASMITNQSQSKRVQQSVLMLSRHKEGQNQSFKLGSLKGKSVMTQSINILSSKQKMQQIIKRQDLRQLKLLDQIVFKSNITKNKNEEDLDVSVEISEGGELKRSIRELQQQCN